MRAGIAITTRAVAAPIIMPTLVIAVMTAPVIMAARIISMLAAPIMAIGMTIAIITMLLTVAMIIAALTLVCRSSRYGEQANCSGRSGQPGEGFEDIHDRISFHATATQE